MRPAGTSPPDRATGTQDATRLRQEDNMTNYAHITTPCGTGQTAAEGATEWIADRHAHGHHKGAGGRWFRRCWQPY
jgi:hypothetical protein